MKNKFLQPILLLVISILFFMKWVVPNYPNQNTSVQNQQGEVIGNYVNMLMSEINVTGFNPSTEQLFDFSFFTEKFNLSGPLFFTLNVVLILLTLIRNFDLLKKIELIKLSTLLSLTLNVILIFYPVYLIYWVNSTINKVINFYKNSNFVSNENPEIFNYVMKINYIVYIVIVLYILNFILEIISTKKYFRK